MRSVDEGPGSHKRIEQALNPGRVCLMHAARLFAPAVRTASALPLPSSNWPARICATIASLLVASVFRADFRRALAGAFSLLLLAPLPLLSGCAPMRTVGRFLQSSAPAPASRVAPESSVPFRLAVLAGHIGLLDQQSSTVLIPSSWPDDRWACLAAQPNADQIAKRLLGHLVLTTELAPNRPFRGALVVRDSMGRPVRWSTPEAGRTFVNDQPVDGVAVRTRTGTILRVAGPVLRPDDFPVCGEVASRAARSRSADLRVAWSSDHRAVQIP